MLASWQLLTPHLNMPIASVISQRTTKLQRFITSDPTDRRVKPSMKMPEDDVGSRRYFASGHQPSTIIV